MTRHLFVLPLVAVLAVACTRHTETPSPFTSPAAELKRIRVEEAYLWEVVKKVRNSRFQADVSQKERITVRFDSSSRAMDGCSTRRSPAQAA